MNEPDLELLFLAVHQGVLTNAQVEDCLRDWEDGRRGATLGAVARRKGYLTDESVRRLLESKDPSDLGGTIARIEVVLGCAACRSEHVFPLGTARVGLRCPECSGVLAFRRGAGTPTPAPRPAPLPPAVERAAADPRNRLGKYVLVGRIGTGGMGEVYRAFDTVLHREVAVKIPKGMGPEEVRRLYLEARGAGGLAHPNIASVYEIAEADGRHYIAMQFIDGRTAEECAREERDPRETARWVRDAARAVQDAHERGILHRDLKPSNLMIDRDSRVYVMDFGLAKLLGAGPAEASTMSGMVLGTPAFMSPEQAAGNAGQLGPRSDVYSLGATLYALLAGRRPYEGDSVAEVLVKVLTREVPPLRRVSPSAPWELEAIAGRAMARTVRDRYDSARDLADDLDRYLAHRPIRARRIGLVRRTMLAFRRHRVAALSALTALLVCVAAVLAARPPAPSTAATDRLRDWVRQFDAIQAALAPEGFRPDEARALLDRSAREFPEQRAAIDAYIETEHRRVGRTLEALPRSTGRESREPAERLRTWLAFVGRSTAPADRILAWKGTVTLSIHVHPYEELRGPLVEGIPAADRFTPLVLRDVEIRDAALELVHPSFGSRTVPLPPLVDGAKAALEGRWDRVESIQWRNGP